MPRVLPLILSATAVGVLSWGWLGLSNTAMDSFIQAQKVCITQLDIMLILTVYTSINKGGRFQYLTIQGLVLAWVTMVLGTLVNLFPSLTGELFFETLLSFSLSLRPSSSLEEIKEGNLHYIYASTCSAGFFF